MYVLITGCSVGGIGSELALEFQRRGHHVFATARDMAKMSHLSNLSNVTLLQLDVTSQESIAAAVDAVTSKSGGKLDILVNNSGAAYVMPMLDSDLARSKSVFDVNVFGMLLTSQEFAPHLVKSKGCIVNICSVSGHLPMPYMSIYQASKAAAEMLSETMRLELAPLGVRVLSLVTGAITSNVMANTPTARVPEGSYYTSAQDEISKLAEDRLGLKRTPADVFAKTVVDDVLGGSSGKVWRGAMAGTTKLMSHYAPSSMIVRIHPFCHCSSSLTCYRDAKMLT